MLAPMMQTEFFPVDINADVGRAQAMLFTSRNGVRAFSACQTGEMLRYSPLGTPRLTWRGISDFPGSRVPAATALTWPVWLPIG